MKMLLLRWRALVLEAQIANGEAMMQDHKERLHACYDELRRVNSQIATNTPARTLLEQALARKAR